MAKESDINIKISLDEQNHPSSIYWQATDGPKGSESREAKAMLISFFDKEHKDTYKIDLWTNEMQVVEMDRLVYQTLKTLAETYYNATKNGDLASAMHQFADYFGEKTEMVLPKQ
jgi:gliding motility-associated protein GldC